MVEYPSPFLKHRAAGNSKVKRGDAILISMETDPPRPGAAVDRGTLQTLFTTLCFNVHSYVDFTAEKLKERLENVATCDTQPSEETSQDSFVLFVSAHEKTDNQGHYIIAPDNQKVYIYNDILKVLINCEALKGIPKVFFINACRGEYSKPVRSSENVAEYMKWRVARVYELANSTFN